MNKVEELIEKFCPDGVEYKTLGEVCNVTIGEFVHKNKQNDKSPYPVYNGGTSFTGFYDEYNNLENTIVISARGANAGYVNKVIRKYWAGNSCYSIRIRDNVKLNWLYLFHFLKRTQKSLEGVQQKGGIPAISKKQVEDISIPIPPLPIQEAIVKILDNFSSLTAELQAELQARKSQYEFYRNQLLTFDREDADTSDLQSDVSSSSLMEDNNLNTTNAQSNSRVTTTIRKPRKVKWMRLGDICNIFDGTHQTPNYTNSGVRFVSVENINNLYDSPKYISKEDYERIYVIKPRIDDVFMTRIGSIGKCAVLDREEPLAYYVTLTLIRPNSKVVLSKYIKYIIESSTGIKELRKKTLVNAVPIKINLGDIGTIEIPIPPLSEQNRIVSILDRFDTLINDISTGLPAEIAARQQQYEYYRDKLLTFKRKEA
jgi:type I restriction enzyme S subunit